MRVYWPLLLSLREFKSLQACKYMYTDHQTRFFEFFITIMSCVKIYRKTGSQNEYEYRIRLPTEPEQRNNAGKNISIAA